MGAYEGDIELIITELSEQENKSRELSLTITKLQEALMWLEAHYKLQETRSNG